jgi:hypothetical protein
VIVEGDAFIGSKAQCAKLCDLLKQITGDNYTVDKLQDVGCLGIREPHLTYMD